MSEEHRGVEICKGLDYVDKPRPTPRDSKDAPGNAVRLAKYQSSIDRGAAKIARGGR